MRMTLDEAIRHAEEVAEKNEEIYEAHCRIYSKEVVEKYPSPPCKKCAEEHQQLAEWLKELKAYRSRSEIPNTCGDAISREELIEALNTWDKFGYAPTNELVPLRGNVDKDKYVPYIHYDDVIECIKGMPSVTKQPCDDAISRQAVMDCLKKWQPYMATRLFDFEKELSALPFITPQQRTGHWIDIMVGDMPAQACDQCNTFYPLAYTGGGHKYCPNCGCKMEVKE